jgi:hypothetical protein
MTYRRSVLSGGIARGWGQGRCRFHAQFASQRYPAPQCATAASLTFNQQLEQHITLGFVRFSCKQPTETSNVLAADESLKSLVMFRCRTIHWESPFSLGLWLGSVFDGLDAAPPFAPQSYDVHQRRTFTFAHSGIYLRRRSLGGLVDNPDCLPATPQLWAFPVPSPCRCRYWLRSARDILWDRSRPLLPTVSSFGSRTADLISASNGLKPCVTHQLARRLKQSRIKLLIMSSKYRPMLLPNDAA